MPIRSKTSAAPHEIGSSELRRFDHIMVNMAHALALESDTLRCKVEQRDREIRRLRKECRMKSKVHVHTTDRKLTLRSETTYLHIIGGLLTLLLGESPSKQPYSSFRTQEAIISAMVAHHGERLGISQRTLHSKFAEARRALTGKSEEVHR